MGLLIESSAHLKVCGCGECWGRIVLSNGKMGALFCSKQEGYHSLKVAVTKGLVNDLERQVVESQIDMSDLPQKVRDARRSIRLAVVMANMDGSKVLPFGDGELAVGVDTEKLSDGLEKLIESGSSDEYIGSVLDADTFTATVDHNPEGLPIC